MIEETTKSAAWASSMARTVVRAMRSTVAPAPSLFTFLVADVEWSAPHLHKLDWGPALWLRFAAL
jgi:hypothetical protein